MAEVLEHFRAELFFRDKLKLIFKCLVRGIHLKENIGLLFKLSHERIDKKYNLLNL